MKKYNLLVPLAGKGKRMLDGGYTFPKPMIMAGDRTILEYGLDSIDYSECNLIFVVRRDHICNFAIDKYLEYKYGSDIKIVVAEFDTTGTVTTCLIAKHLIDNSIPLIVFCPDVHFNPKFVPTDDIFNSEGFLLTFKANSPNYSYVCVEKDGTVSKAVEKVVISDNASVGVYCFKTGKSFVSLAEQGQAYPLQPGQEHYVCPLYNLLIAAGGTVRVKSVPTMYIMGTPDEMSFFKSAILPYLLDRSFILCSDHSGFECKELVKSCISTLEKELNVTIKVIDCGCYSLKDCDYSDYIDQAVETRKYYPGGLILGFCRSGQGVGIHANKKAGIRAALVDTEESASLAIRHNAANFFAIPGGKVTPEELLKIIRVLYTEIFEGGRHQNRLQKGNK
jgi:RpiB/LacA/LacB family sugar-phosphate isomerase